MFATPPLELYSLDKIYDIPKWLKLPKSATFNLKKLYLFLDLFIDLLFWIDHLNILPLIGWVLVKEFDSNFLNCLISKYCLPKYPFVNFRTIATSYLILAENLVVYPAQKEILHWLNLIIPLIFTQPHNKN